MKILVQYEPKKVRFAVAQCPICKNWFNIYDVTEELIHDEYDLKYGVYNCPVCNREFEATDIEEKHHEDFPKTLEKKISLT